MNDILYVVFQEGVYRHACCGIFTDKDTAINCAKHFALNDGDSYHTYEVTIFTLNTFTLKKDGSILENDCIFRCDKNRVDGIPYPDKVETVNLQALSRIMINQFTPEMIEKLKQDGS